MARIIIGILMLGMVGSFTMLGMNGVWGESSAVTSTRVGSGGGGYGTSGRVK